MAGWREARKYKMMCVAQTNNLKLTLVFLMSINPFFFTGSFLMKLCDLRGGGRVSDWRLRRGRKKAPSRLPPIYWQEKLEYLTAGSSQGGEEGAEGACHYAQTACGLHLLARNGNSLPLNEDVKVISNEPAEPDVAPCASERQTIHIELIHTT